MKSSHTKVLSLSLLLLVGALVLAGCTAPAPKPTEAPFVTLAPTEAPTTVPTEVPATEVPATEVPATEVPVVKVPTTQIATVQPLLITLEELAAFNGKDGNRGYIAVDGIIYDVTDNSKWKDGKHEGQTAGHDETAQIKASPHGVKYLDLVPVVGRLSQGTDLTLTQLAEFNGKDGKKAYVAVDGIIYDVTGNASWTDGAHKGLAAGTDVTQGLAASPHGAAVLDTLTVVGRIIN